MSIAALQRTTRPQNDRSSNLKDVENNQLIDYCRSKNIVSLATVIVQLYLTEKPDHRKWTKRHTGILCFIKDYERRSYFFRLFNLNITQLWEQEMYTPFAYNKLTNTFHYFAADDCNAGFNFADQYEADKFFKTVNEKIDTKMKRTQTRNNKIYDTVTTENQYESTGRVQKAPLVAQPVTLNINQSSQEKPVQAPSNDKGKFNTLKSKNKKFSKADISNPTNFRVVQHVGLSTTSNNFEFNLDKNDQISEEYKKILSELNINMPLNKKTKNFVESFINQHGGVEEFKKELNKQKQAPQPPAPPRLPPAIENYPQVPEIPPPIPPNPMRQARPGQMKPSNAPPPPPPPPPPLPPMPPNESHSGYNIGSPSQPPPPPPPPPIGRPQAPVMSPPSSSMHGGPPPPPPPPPPIGGFTSSAPPPPPPPIGGLLSPPQPPPVPNLTGVSSSSISSSSSSSNKPSTPIGDNTALLESIRQFQGFRERPVSPNQQQKRTSEPQAPQENSILDQLKNALIERQQFLKDSSDEDSSESESEWQ